MLSAAADALPAGEGWQFEPKWDGFRTIVFRDGDEVYLQSRDLKPLDRYFPELHDPLVRMLPERCVMDGEIVIAGEGGLDFEALLLRIHPAASRVKMLAEQSPSSFVAWICWRSATTISASSRSRSGERSWRPRSARRRRRFTCPRPPATARSPRTGSAASKAPGSTA